MGVERREHDVILLEPRQRFEDLGGLWTPRAVLLEFLAEEPEVERVPALQPLLALAHVGLEALAVLAQHVHELPLDHGEGLLQGFHPLEVARVVERARGNARQIVGRALQAVGIGRADAVNGASRDLEDGLQAQRGQTALDGRQRIDLLQDVLEAPVIFESR